MWLLSITVIVVAIPPVIPGFMGKAVYVEIHATGGYTMMFDDKWIYLSGPVIILLYIALSAVASFILDVRTAIVYRSLTAANRSRYRRDFSLFGEHMSMQRALCVSV